MGWNGMIVYDETKRNDSKNWLKGMLARWDGMECNVVWYDM
jgi:hypothetical protein